MIKQQIIFILILALSVISCSNDNKSISTYTVSTKNFENTVKVEGFAEPVQSLNIVCPRSGSGGTVAYIIEDGTWVEKGDVLCSIEKQSLQTEYDQLLLDYESKQAEKEKTMADFKMQYALLEADVRNNDAETQISRLDSSRLQYYSTNQRLIRELELRIVGITRKKIEAKLAALAVIQESEVKKMELEVRQFSNQIAMKKGALDALVLKAPEKGMAVVATNDMTDKKLVVGDALWNNMPLVNLPVMDKMKMKILVSERDFKYININDSVRYSFDALHDNIAWGKIQKKMPVGRQIKRDSKVKYFEIEASIDSTLILPDPGFTATCQIFLKQVSDTIVVPQIAVFEQDSMKVVYVEKSKGFEMRQILLGESSPKESVVTKGLHLNERIALSRPAMSQIKSEKRLSDSIQIVKK